MNKSGLKIFYLQMHAWLMFHSEEPSTEFPVPILDKNALQWVLLIIGSLYKKKTFTGRWMHGYQTKDDQTLS